MFVAGFQSCRFNLFTSSKLQSLNQFVRSARFGRVERRTDFRKRLNLLKNGTKKAERGEFIIPGQGDTASLRPVSDIWKALGFTLMVGGTSFSVAAILDYEKSKKHMKQFWNDTVTLFPSFSDFGAENKMWSTLSDGQKCVFTLLGLNGLVFLLWRINSLQPFMWRWFTNSFASKSLCLPMLLSAFSHSNSLHLFLNMYVVYSFCGRTVDKFLGVDQFGAFYLTAAVVSSFTSMVHKAVIGSPIKALGASGAILAVLAYTCIRTPEARLQIVFLPIFTFSAYSAVMGLVAFDAAGLLLGFRLFDHAAHLGGTLFGIKVTEDHIGLPVIKKSCSHILHLPYSCKFSSVAIYLGRAVIMCLSQYVGIFYAYYGDQLLWKKFGDSVIGLYRRITGKNE